MRRTGWIVSVLVVAQLLSSAWFRATYHSNAVDEIVTSYGYPESAITARAAVPLIVGTLLRGGGLYLRDSGIRQLVPFRRPNLRPPA